MRRKLETGEDHASAYLKGSFGRISSGDATSPLDRTCHDLLQSRDSTLLWSDPTLRFHFQVKEGHSWWKDGIPVRASTFESWLRHVQRQPVFLLYVREINATSQEYWFLGLHDWLLTEAAQPYLAQEAPGPRFNIKREFSRSDRDAHNFHEALLAEGSRAAREDGSPWATLDDWTVFPFDELFLLRHMEKATLLELPAQVLRDVRAHAPLGWRQHVRQHLLGEARDVRTMSEWLASLRQLSEFVPSGTSFQRKQFLRFVKTVNDFEQQGTLRRLPPFQVGEVGCWRAFVALYPGSMRMLHQVLASSPHANDIMFAAALLPILALSEDGGVSDSARLTLRLVQDKVTSASVSTLAAYAFEREMLRSLAESGDRRCGAKLVDYLAKHGVPNFEKRFLTEYGWPAASVPGNIERKLNRPTRRDENLRSLYEVIGDLVVSGRASPNARLKRTRLSVNYQ